MFLFSAWAITESSPYVYRGHKSRGLSQGRILAIGSTHLFLGFTCFFPTLSLRRLSMANHRARLSTMRPLTQKHPLDKNRSRKGGWRAADRTQQHMSKQQHIIFRLRHPSMEALPNHNPGKSGDARSALFFPPAPNGVLDDGPLSSHTSVPQQRRRSRAAGNR